MTSKEKDIVKVTTVDKVAITSEHTRREAMQKEIEMAKSTSSEKEQLDLILNRRHPRVLRALGTNTSLTDKAQSAMLELLYPEKVAERSKLHSMEVLSIEAVLAENPASNTDTLKKILLNGRSGSRAVVIKRKDTVELQHLAYQTGRIKVKMALAEVEELLSPVENMLRSDPEEAVRKAINNRARLSKNLRRGEIGAPATE